MPRIKHSGDERIAADRARGEMDRLEAVAEAIYMTHWRLPREAMMGLAQPVPPVWADASEAVKEWVRAQARNAIEAADAAD